MPTSVLIVDDHSSFRATARAVLADAGYVVVGEAADAESASAAARELRPDCVLLDVQLGDVDGFAVADALAAEEDGPVVVLTSGRDPRDIEPLCSGERGARVHSQGAAFSVCARGVSAVSFAVAPVATPQRARAFTVAVSVAAAAAAAGGVVAIAAGVIRNDTRTLAAVTLVAALSFVGSGLVA